LSDPNAKVVNMITASGLRWKRQRFIINPTFSSAKLKQMTPLIHRSIGMLMRKISEENNNNQPFDIYTYFKRFTMDTIWSCGFGLDTDMQNNINDPYLVYSQQMFGDKVNLQLMVILTLFISELRKLWRVIHVSKSRISHWCLEHIPITKHFINGNPATWIINQAYKMIEKQQQLGQTKRTDLLQLMLESASDEEFIQV
jgi:cytochrome P450